MFSQKASERFAEPRSKVMIREIRAETRPIGRSFDELTWIRLRKCAAQCTYTAEGWYSLKMAWTSPQKTQTLLQLRRSSGQSDGHLRVQFLTYVQGWFQLTDLPLCRLSPRNPETLPGSQWHPSIWSLLRPGPFLRCRLSHRQWWRSSWRPWLWRQSAPEW